MYEQHYVAVTVHLPFVVGACNIRLQLLEFSRDRVNALLQVRHIRHRTLLEASTCVFVTIPRKSLLHVIKLFLLLLALLDRQLGLLDASHKVHVRVQVLHVLLDVFADLLELGLDLLCATLGQIVEVLPQILELVLNFSLQSILKFLAVGT